MHSGRRFSRLPFAMLATLGLSVFTAYALNYAGREHAPSAHAQQPPPINTPRPQDEAMFKRYATRHVLPLPSASGAVGGRTLSLHVFNNSDEPTQIVVLLLAGTTAPTGAGCSNGLPPERLLDVRCARQVAGNSTLELALTADLASLALVYSLSALTPTIACETIAQVKSGAQSLDAWEREVWARNAGQPVGVTVEGTAGGGVTSVTGRTGFEVGPGRPSGQPGPPGGPQGSLRQQILPLLPSSPGSGLAGVRLLNPTSQCQTLQEREGVVSQGGGTGGANCTVPEWQPRSVPAYSAMDILPSATAVAAASVAITGNGQAMAFAEQHGSSGWWSYVGGNAGGSVDATSLAFPLAVSPFTNETAELWVTNQHPTATAQIGIIAWDGSGQLVKAYNDPVPLCPGATRQYDPRAIIGPLGPSRSDGRGLMGWQLPPMASLRVESSNRALMDAPPIGAVMVLKNDLGVSAYGGFGANNDVEAIRGPRFNRVRVITVVPDVKINFGSPPESTFLAGMNLVNPQANVMLINLYDMSGKLVAEDIEVPLGSGLAGASTVDLTLHAGRRFGPGALNQVPQTFHGSATIRGSDAGPFGQIAVLAANHRSGDIAARRMNPPTPMPPLGGPDDRLGEQPLTSRPQRMVRPLWDDEPERPDPGSQPDRADGLDQAVDRLAITAGLFVPRWFPTSAVTPTPRPTLTPRPGGDEPTATPIPTGSGPGQRPRRLWLPALLLHSSPEQAGSVTGRPALPARR